MSNEGFGGNGSRVGSVIMVNKSWPSEHELACFYDVSVGNVPTRIYLLSSHLSFTFFFFFFFAVGLWNRAATLKEENVFIFSLETNTVSAFHRVVCCTWSLSRCLLCGLPRRWKLRVFKSLIFNVSQSIKVCFFISNWLLLIAGLLPVLLALPSCLLLLSTSQIDRLTLWVFLMGSNGLKALMISGARQVHPCVWPQGLSHRGAPQPSSCPLDLK